MKITEVELREALGQELAVHRSWAFPRREGIPFNREQGIMTLKAYQNKMYAWQNSAGVIWEFDGRDWSIAYEVPLADVIANARLGVSYEAELFGIFLQFGSVQFDGTIWKPITGLPANYSINSLKVYNGRLYAIVTALPQVRNLYVSDDGIAFNAIWEAPAAQADYLRSLEVYWDNLYIGGCRAGAAPIYRFTGTLPPTLVHTTTDLEVGALRAIGGRLFAFTHATEAVDGDIYVYADPLQTRYVPTIWTALGCTLAGHPFSARVEWRGARVFPASHSYGYIYAIYSDFRSRFIATPMAHSNYSSTSAELFNGKLYICHEGPICLEAIAASVWEYDELSTNIIPVHYRLWKDKAVPNAGARTFALPTAGGRKTFYLLSDQNGDVTIEVDIDGGGQGTYQTFDTEAVVANTLWRYTTLDEFCWARLFFDPAADATVQAWLNVVPE